MIDAALFAFVLGALALGLKRPFLWVLAYIYIDIVAPQKIGWALTQAMPISLIAFCAAFAGWALTDRKAGTRLHYRQALMAALLAICAMTLQWSAFPEPAATKWDWVWKALVFAIFLPFTLTTRLRIEAAALIMVLSAGAIIVNGGIKTVLGGGGYEGLHLYVNDNSGVYESSILSLLAIAIIPLIWWFARHGTVFRPDWRVKLFAWALIFACLLIPVGTEARTGLVCLAVLVPLVLRDVRRRFVLIAAGSALAFASLPFLPASFYERMATITTPQEDESAFTRVAVWDWTLDYVAEHPLGGGFDAYRANSFTYDQRIETGSGSTTAIEYREVTDEARAYHSAYFEVLGEQGWPGLAVWLLLHVSGLWQMERLRRRWRRRAAASGDPGEAWQAPLASALQSAQAVYLVGALFVGVAYQPFILLLIALQCGLWNWCRRAERAAAPEPRGIARRPTPSRAPALR